MDLSGEEENKRSSVERKKRSRSSSERRFSKRRSSRSKSRNRKYQRSLSRSRSPFHGRSGFRGGNRTRFARRSPFRGGRNFRDRFRRSRSTSRGRFDRKDRRFDSSRRSRSESPQKRIDNYRQNQPQQMNYQNDPYNNYMQSVPPQAPTFGAMNQFGSYDFQAANYPPPAPNFNISCPAPPGIQGDSWIPQQSMPPNMPEESEGEKKKRQAAIAEEKKRQREELKKQRDQYISRAEKMKRELKTLKDQKANLLDGVGKRSLSPKTNGFIKENEKLQSQISVKLNEILNVIDMLNRIIGKDSDDEETTKKKSSKRSRKSESDDSSPERIKSELLESMKRKKQEAEEKKEKVNYIYFDSELHWCKHCQVFPKTVKDYLNHLHTKEHLEKIANRSTEGPWRVSFQKLNEVTNHPDAPTERVSIKGLQFFEPSTAWFCKLCEMFMGDSWCVSLHLKSDIHAQRYNKLIEREPKFEEKWLEARNKAFELSGLGSNNDHIINNSNDKSNLESTNNNKDIKKSTDKKSKKKKNKKDSKKKRKHGKKRKRGSSSSSSDNSDENSGTSSESESSSSKKHDSDHGDAKNSIRVAMRNILSKGSNENDEKSGKWTMIPIDSNKPSAPPAPTISAHAIKENKKDEQIIGQWSTIEPIISQEEKRLLENLKGRLKTNSKQQDSIDTEKHQVAEKKDKDIAKDKARSRSRDRHRNDRNYRSKRSRSRSNSLRRRSRSRSRGRYRRRYSRSRSRPKYEKSSFNFPTEPKMPPLKDEKKMPSRSYSSNTTKKDESSSSVANAAKKMPFIGKMPVFKKQMVDKKNEDQPEEKKEEAPANKQKTKEEVRKANEKWEELIPDPMQFSAMMNSNALPQQEQQLQQPQHSMNNDEEIDAPPGLDYFEDFPKPISDAPPLKTGPLPDDFQATLDLLFDGDKPKKAIIEAPPPPEIIKPEVLPINPPNDGPQMIMPEELSQHAILYGSFFQQGVQPVPPPPPVSSEKSKEDPKNDEHSENNEESTEKFPSQTCQDDMDDLALLGIDVNDVGSGLW